MGKPKTYRFSAAWLVAMLLVAAGCSSDAGSAGNAGSDATSDAAGTASTAPATDSRTAEATFAGGCFWCMEPPFDALEGVVSTTSGYIGGHVDDPTYKQVSAGGTGHAEAVRIVYRPETVGYEKLLDVFWHNIDPTVEDRQFCDVGDQYRTAIFYHDAEQKRLAEKSKKELAESGVLPGPIHTEIVKASTFHPAEDYHQDYYEKNPIRYKFYRFNCGRDQRLEEIWGASEKP